MVLLEKWNVRPVSVTGHSSGEIAAAYACGAITMEAALSISYHRGYLASTMLENGKLRGAMIAVGLSEIETEAFIARLPEERGKAVIACVNSPSSVTVSGDRTAILALQSMLEARHVFVRKLRVSTAYHSHHMEIVAHSYSIELQKLSIKKPVADTGVIFHSSVTGGTLDGSQLDAAYWVKNMVSQVKFCKSFQSLCHDSSTSQSKPESGVRSRWTKPAVDLILEVGPHSGLAGFVKQNLVSLQQTKIRYTTCLAHAKNAVQTMLSAASNLLVSGYSVDLRTINFDNVERHPQVLVDLASYPWDHSVGYWHESRLSLNYRKRSAPRHPLLGAPSSDFNALEPSWRNIIRPSEIPWIRGHVIQSNIVYPAAGYISMAIEASLQRSQLNGRAHAIRLYKVREVSIKNMLLIPDDASGVETVFSLRPYNRSVRVSSDEWDEFRVFSYDNAGQWTEHCRGLVSVEYHKTWSDVEGDREAELKLASHCDKLTTAKAQCRNFINPIQLYSDWHAIGLEFSDSFQCIKDARFGLDQSLGSICIPDTASVMTEKLQLPHVLHPATLDACMQVTSISFMKAGTVLSPKVPTFIKELHVMSDIPHKPGTQLIVHGSAVVAGKRSTTSSFSVSSPTIGGTRPPAIEVFGLSCTAVGDSASFEPSTRDTSQCHKLQWIPVETLIDKGFEFKDQTHTVLAPRVTTNGTKGSSRSSVVLIQPANCSPFLNAVVSELAKDLATSLLYTSSDVEDIVTAGLDDKICIFLAGIETSILHDCTEALWHSIRSMLSSASKVIWITCGGAMDTSSPESGLVTGLVRSSRSDNEALHLVTLDLDPNEPSPEQTTNTILEVLDKSFTSNTKQSTDDFEFAVRGGRLLVPRLMEDHDLQRYLTASTTFSRPEVELQPFFQNDRVLRLEVSTPGLLDSLRFIEDGTANWPLAAHELKMSPRAFGVNFRDVMIALGQLEESSLMSSEHSGIVTEVGIDLQDQFAVGDRICACGGNSYASSIRVKGTDTYKIPDGMSFETAASVPIVYATAYYALIHLGRLRRGESILIHSAAGGVGQAAVMLAKYLGAVVFVTVGNSDKKAHLMNKYNISEDYIFSSRQKTFVDGIERLTGGKGVDVALNSIAGEGFHETWRCMAKMGRFIEIGKRDILANTRLNMEMFNHNITFASIDLNIVFDHDPNLAKQMLGEVFRLFRVGALKPVELNVFPLSKIEDTFRFIQSGKHIGKVILKAEADSQVKVVAFQYHAFSSTDCFETGPAETCCRCNIRAKCILSDCWWFGRFGPRNVFMDGTQRL